MKFKKFLIPLMMLISLSSCGIEGPKGEQGDKGEDGVSIISIEKTISEGLVDIYTIYFSDGTTSTFTVTNGEDGSQGIQGLPGKDGYVPEIEIGENGNWFIDGVDTGYTSKGEDGKDGEDGEDSPHYGETFVVNFHLNGGNLPPDYRVTESTVVERGDTVELSEPTKSGYNFVGWFTGDDVNSKQFFSYDAVFSDLDLYARYEVNDNPVIQINSFKYEINTDVKEAYFVELIGTAQTNITIPEYVRYEGTDYPIVKIKHGATSSNTRKVTSIKLPNNLKEIEYYNFSDCENLLNIDFGNGLEKIGTSVFTNNSTMTTLEIPDSVTSIAFGAFGNFSALKSLHVGKNLSKFNFMYSFSYKLNKITVDEENKYYDSRENCNAIIETKSNKVVFGCSLTNIPRSVTEIGDFAFENVKELKTIDLKEIKKIGKGAFLGSDVEEIILPNTLEDIESAAFSSSKLKTITISSQVKNIGDDCFSQCLLENIFVSPDNISSLTE